VSATVCGDVGVLAAGLGDRGRVRRALLAVLRQYPDVEGTQNRRTLNSHHRLLLLLLPLPLHLFSAPLSTYRTTRHHLDLSPASFETHGSQLGAHCTACRHTSGFVYLLVVGRLWGCVCRVSYGKLVS